MTEIIFCACGDEEDAHIDGCEQCVICGCKEFEQEETEEEKELAEIEAREQHRADSLEDANIEA